IGDAHRLGSVVLARPRAELARHGVREPSRERRSAGESARVVRRELSSPSRAQGEIRPEELVPLDGERRAVNVVAQRALTAPTPAALGPAGPSERLRPRPPKPKRPSSPLPSKPSAPGSGTGGAFSVYDTLSVSMMRWLLLWAPARNPNRIRPPFK